MLPSVIIQQKIYLIRGEQVMLDFDLAVLYGIETRVLNQAVKRNIKRFPPDFMFQLNKEEWEDLKSQIVISSWGGNINEDTRMQLELINQALAELQSFKKREEKPRNPIGFVKPKQ